jgi:tetratricopeptide (TPR) repeat protein
LSSVSGRYVDSYYRIFSQTNLALANSLASSIPAGAKVSAQTTQTVYTLVQQSINAARQATTVSPQNAINWENLASIYRALIGFGQNADSFALLAQQQATQLNSTNPQEYIALGGIYYQLSSWDKAQENFQQAINLKADYANAYYNLGHVLLQKGDLKGALTQFQTVASLIPNDPVNLSKINGEIKALETQIGQQQSTQTTQPNTQNQSQGTPLTTPAAQTLPPQQPPVKIPAPQITPTPSTSPTPSQTPSPTP